MLLNNIIAALSTSFNSLTLTKDQGCSGVIGDVQKSREMFFLTFNFQLAVPNTQDFLRIALADTVICLFTFHVGFSFIGLIEVQLYF